MPAYLVGSVAARIATVLCVIVIALPYGLRRNRVSEWLGIQPRAGVSYRARMWPHFWMGYVILALSIAHVGLAMSAMGRANPTGILAATAAFFLLLFEIALGLTLRKPSAASRKSLLRIQFWMMVAFLAMLAVHVWLT